MLSWIFLFFLEKNKSASATNNNKKAKMTDATKHNPLRSDLNCIYRVLSYIPAFRVNDKIGIALHPLFSTVCASWREVVVDYSTSVGAFKACVRGTPYEK